MELMETHYLFEGNRVQDLPDFIVKQYNGKLVFARYEHKNEIHEWARENNVTISFVGKQFIYDVWYVKEDEHRVYFMLRWS